MSGSLPDDAAAGAAGGDLAAATEPEGEGGPDAIALRVRRARSGARPPRAAVERQAHELALREREGLRAGLRGVCLIHVLCLVGELDPGIGIPGRRLDPPREQTFPPPIEG